MNGYDLIAGSFSLLGAIGCFASFAFSGPNQTVWRILPLYVRVSLVALGVTLIFRGVDLIVGSVDPFGNHVDLLADFSSAAMACFFGSASVSLACSRKDRKTLDREKDRNAA